ncbi:MAG TPA: hypothetical protein VKA67_08525 [Verrucomicrobiae bacterium]|nr:hypothetical protein [Verrucomicrobiae bacterium]
MSVYHDCSFTIIFDLFPQQTTSSQKRKATQSKWPINLTFSPPFGKREPQLVGEQSHPIHKPLGQQEKIQKSYANDILWEKAPEIQSIRGTRKLIRGRE